MGISLLDVDDIKKDEYFIMLIQDIIALSKPRITFMVLLTTAVGAGLAPKTIAWTEWVYLLVGSAFLIGAANALNMYLEHEIDALMERTKKRPLPDKRMSPTLALILGLCSGIGSVAWLAWFLNPLCGLVGAVAIVSYAFVYTPLKCKTSTAMWIGAIPGAMGPLLGWTGVMGTFQLNAWFLFIVMFWWQIPHFHAISFIYETDYARAGIRTTVSSIGFHATKRSILICLWMQLLVSLLPVYWGNAEMLYSIVAIVSGVAYLVIAYRPVDHINKELWSRQLFHVSLGYLPLLFIALLVEKAL